MSYKITMTQWLSGTIPTCALSGKRISISDKVMDVNRESMQRYGKFLSEQTQVLC